MLPYPDSLLELKLEHLTSNISIYLIQISYAFLLLFTTSFSDPPGQFLSLIRTLPPYLGALDYMTHLFSCLVAFILLFLTLILSSYAEKIQLLERLKPFPS